MGLRDSGGYEIDSSPEEILEEERELHKIIEGLLVRAKSIKRSMSLSGCCPVQANEPKRA
jgi:hypothetical protein